MNSIKLFKFFIYIISPPICSFCKIFLQNDDILCSDCYRKIQPIVSKSIQVTPSIEMRVLAAGAYQEPLKSLILSKSYSDKAMSTIVGQLIWQLSFIRNSSFDYIIPIPLHWTRYAWRGYNQAEVIAQYIAKKSGKPIIRALQRNRYSPFLSRVKNIERAEIMKNIFSATNLASTIQGKHILLVDDLMTTGVTLKIAARELIKYKPKEITAVVAARVI